MDIITGRIKQHYVVSSVNSSSFQQSCSDLLSSLVQLRTRGCAHCYTLKAKARSVSLQNGLTKLSFFLMGVVCPCHLCIQQHIEDIIRICLCSPLQGFRQELML